MTQQIALVTGGNKGIGFSIVRALCKEVKECIVYLTARNEERGKAAVEELKKEGLQPRFHQLDIDSLESIDRLKEFLKSTHGGLDILVNNAGVYKPNDVQAKMIIATNYTGTLNVCRALLPIIRPHGRSVEKETLIEEGWVQAAYDVSKMGVIALTKIQAAALNSDSSKQDVLINCCCPGYVNTDMTDHKGIKTPDEGAVTPVFCVLLPANSSEYQGNFLSDKTVVETW
ncbi:carbonyl reductase [NADPH] 3-like isoform X2 [Anneissia japonica]|uniref:carbonyl reductase [NADPH] 3-like isoform X2 n=1 Tax=Anneissia japonica TaxID=1529436 RepID=UPI0014258326|nr:carbonyl reductase [NADPH] 3-like isoform X2 [Anneissia japonica]